jgi:hypothetical protein
MNNLKKYPQSPLEIDADKILWAFWQSSYSYNFNNEFACLFTCEVKASDEKIYSSIFYKAFGTFSLYKIFKMSNGEYGIDKTRSLNTIEISSDMHIIKTLEKFKQLGVFESLSQYLLSDEYKALISQ